MIPNNETPITQPTSENLPGLELLQKLVSANGEYQLSVEEQSSLNILWRNKIYRALCDYILQNPRSVPTGKCLALIAGSLNRRFPKGGTFSVNFDPVAACHGAPFVPTVDPNSRMRIQLTEETLKQYIQSVDDDVLVDNFTPKLETTLWDHWIDESTFDENQKIIIRRLLRMASVELLWKIKNGLRGSTGLGQAAVKSLYEDFKIDSFDLPRDYNNELLEILAKLKEYFSDFNLADIKFGDCYDVFDDDRTTEFNFYYSKALAILLCRSGPMDDFVKASTELWNFDLGAGLFSAQMNLSIQDFRLEWSNALKGAFLRWTPLVKEKMQTVYTVEMFKSLLRLNIKNYEDLLHSDPYFSPYLAVCNSSGVGKTRLALDLGHEFLSFFICLRSKKSTGHPPRSSIANFICSSKVTTASDLQKLLICILQTWIAIIPQWLAVKGAKRKITAVYNKVCGVTGANFLKIMNDMIAFNDDQFTSKDFSLRQKSFHTYFWDAVEASYDTTRGFVVDLHIEGSDRSNADMEASAVNKDAQSCFKLLFSEAQKILEKYFNIRSGHTVPITFVFDEARGLLNADGSYQGSRFQALRHGCRPMTGNGFIILTDTLSKISNFSFSATRDNSSRIPHVRKNFPPVLYLPLINVVEVHSKGAPSLVPGKRGYKPLSYHILEELDVGRPMFSASANSAIAASKERTREPINPLEIWNSMFLLAKSKFIGDNRGVGDGLVANSEKLAVIAAKLGCRYATNLINVELMSTYMAFGTNISPDLELLEARYLGEPLLSEVATRVLLEDSDSLKSHIICLRDSILNGSCVIADVGSTGELLMSLLLCLARDTVSRGLNWEQKVVLWSHRVCEPIVVGEFLERIVPNRTLLSELPLRLKSSFVSFASMFQMTPSSVIKAVMPSDKPVLITKRLLYRAWKNRVALYAPPGSAGVDIVIPIVYGDTVKSGGEGSVQATEETMQCIAVQVKNRRDNRINVEKVGDDLIESPIFEPSTRPILGILCNVGSADLDLKVYISQSKVPVLVLHRDHILTALNLPEPICQIIRSISEIDPGAQERIFRCYDPTLSAEPAREFSRLMMSHMTIDMDFGARRQNDSLEQSLPAGSKRSRTVEETEDEGLSEA